VQRCAPQAVLQPLDSMRSRGLQAVWHRTAGPTLQHAAAHSQRHNAALLFHCAWYMIQRCHIGQVLV